MSPWQQARVCDLSEAWDEIHGGKTYGKAKWISERVHVQGLGRKHPTPEAVSQLIKKTTEDPDWFPGKIYGSLGGRPPLVSETNKSIMANSAMAMKERGIEPTYSLIIAQCPNASINPTTIRWRTCVFKECFHGWTSALTRTTCALRGKRLCTGYGMWRW